MKYCPNCRTEYQDDNLQFCLQDGTPLETANFDTSPNVEGEPETLVIPKKVVPINFEPPSSYQTNQPNWDANRESWQPNQPVIVEQRREKKSNTAMVVALTFLGTLLLLGVGGLGAWFLLRDKGKTEIALNVNTAPNRNSNSSQNAITPTPSPTAAPTAQPTLRPEDAKKITGEVKDVVDEWKDSTENLDLDTHIAQYADTVDYYKAGPVSVARVRADRDRAFSAYDSISINLDNIRVTPDASGDKATVILDKEWDFEGADGKYSRGKVQQQLNFGRISGRWKITGEKDLKVYYTDK